MLRSLLPSALLVVLACAADATPSASGPGSGATSGSGTGSASGSGSSGGSGGPPFPPPCVDPGLTSICDGEATECGDGHRDTCDVCWSSDSGPITCEEVTEPCDGDDLGGETCASLGFAGGGALVCGVACGLDVRDCDPCLTEPAVAACARPRIDGTGLAMLALATNEQQIAAAWLDFDRHLHFARFGPDLQVVSESPCETLPDGLTVALASHPGGWALAVGGTGDTPDVVLRILGAEGETVGERLIEGATAPLLVDRPGRTPLLVTRTTDFAGSATSPLTAELVAADGTAQWSVPLGDAWDGSYAAAFADPGFVIGLRPAAAPTPETRFVALAEDGQQGATADLPQSRELRLAAAGAGFVGASWRDADAEQVVAVLAADLVGGVPPPLTLDAVDPIAADQRRALAFADDRLVVTWVRDVRRELVAAHTNAAATTFVLPGYVVAREPSEVSSLEAVPFQGDVVVAFAPWSPDPNGARFVLGRLLP